MTTALICGDRRKCLQILVSKFVVLAFPLTATVPLALMSQISSTRLDIPLVELHVSLCTRVVPGTCRGQKRALDTLELESLIIASCHVGSEI